MPPGDDDVRRREGRCHRGMTMSSDDDAVGWRFRRMGNLALGRHPPRKRGIQRLLDFLDPPVKPEDDDVAAGGTMPPGDDDVIG